jgi:hypothetical protein
LGPLREVAPRAARHAALHVELPESLHGTALCVVEALERAVADEAAAVEALEKAEAKLTELSDPSRPAVVSKKIGPIADSSRIAAAKAEVIRLVEMNRQKEAAAVAEVVVAEPEAAIAEPEVAVAVAEVVVVEPEVVIAEPEEVGAEFAAVVAEPEVAVAESETPIAEAETDGVASEAAPVVKKAPAHAELFSLD